MAKGGVHFEVFLKSSRKDGWKLVEAHVKREDAIAQAKALLAQNPAGSVRVAKEMFCEQERVFRSLSIYQAGGEKYEDDGRADRKAELPCRGPGDLSGAHARQTISRVLSGWLTRQKALALELLYRVDLVEKLEASDTELQHAIQKIAIAQASASDASAQHFVKQINQLVQQAIERLYAEMRAGKTPSLKPGELPALAACLNDAPDRDHLMRGALTMRLKSAKGWTDKLTGILDLADEAEACHADAPWAQDVVAEFIAEIVAIPDARATLLAGKPDLGGTLDALTHLVCGTDGDGLSENGQRLVAHFARRRFRDGRVAIAQYVLKELKSTKRLNPQNFDAEVALNRALADRLITMTGDLFTVEEISEAFVNRSGRLLEPEAVDAYLATSENAGHALTRMVALEENIVGDHNKRKLASYLRAQMGAHGTERWFVYEKTPPLQRLSELAALRRGLDASSFAEADRSEISAKIDALAGTVEADAKLFDTIQKRAMPPLDKAMAFLRLAAKGALPAGRLIDEARARAVKVLSSADARTAMASGDAETRAKAAEIATLMAEMGGTKAAA